MFSDEITQTDSFLDLPSTTQLLYFHLGMNADDDGFISSPRMVMRVMKAGDDDLKLLFAKKFLLSFENGVCVVKHWRINNYIRKDIYKPTKYLKEKKTLFIRSNGAYSFNPKNAVPVPEGHFTITESIVKILPYTLRARDVDLDKIRLDKIRLDKKESKKKTKTSLSKNKKFIKPKIKEISTYCKERKNNIEPERFFDFYESKGWYVGKNLMKDWKASVRTWEKRNYENFGKVKNNKYEKFNK